MVHCGSGRCVVAVEMVVVMVRRWGHAGVLLGSRMVTAAHGRALGHGREGGGMGRNRTEVGGHGAGVFDAAAVVRGSPVMRPSGRMLLRRAHPHGQGRMGHRSGRDRAQIGGWMERRGRRSLHAPNANPGR